MAQLKCKHQVLPINFYSQFFIEIEWLEHFTTLEACKTGLTMVHLRFPNGQQTIWEHFRKLEEQFKSQKWKNRINQLL